MLSMKDTPQQFCTGSFGTNSRFPDTHNEAIGLASRARSEELFLQFVYTRSALPAFYNFNQRPHESGALARKAGLTCSGLTCLVTIAM